jgi:hypothetical protein
MVTVSHPAKKCASVTHATPDLCVPSCAQGLANASTALVTVVLMGGEVTTASYLDVLVTARTAAAKAPATR